MHSKEAQERLYKRTLWIVILSQTFGGAGLAAGITVGALLAQQMIGYIKCGGITDGIIYLRIGIIRLSSRALSQITEDVSDFPLDLLRGIGSDWGRFCSKNSEVLFLFLSLFVYGAGTSTNLQARYAGTDLAGPNQRAKAVSIAMVATTLGAVAGPNLVTPTGAIAKSIGMPELTGPFILAAVAYLLAGISFFIFLRPDPLIVAKAIALENKKLEKASAGSGEVALKAQNI